MLRPLLLLLVFTGIASAQTDALRGVSVVASSESQDKVQAFSPNGLLTLTVSRFSVDLTLPNAKKERGTVVAIHEPKSGQRLWYYTRGDQYSRLDNLKSGLEAIYVEPNRAVSFIYSGGLVIYVFKGRAATMSVAKQSALDELQEELANIQNLDSLRGNPNLEIKTLWMTPHPAPFPGEFYNLPYGTRGCAACQEPIRVVDVARQGANWRLVLRSRWDQEMILDSKLDFVSTRQLTDGPK